MISQTSSQWVERYKLLTAMAEVIKHLDDKTAYHSWVSKFYKYEDFDGCLKSMAMDDYVFTNALKDFTYLMAIYAPSGWKINNTKFGG